MQSIKKVVLPLTAALAGVVLLIYSQTAAFAWDEGFHLLAAQLILRGKRPYLDFLFSQTPLNTYWNAGWMAVFGETWRVPHAVAAVATTAAVLLVADYVWRRFPVADWRPALAVWTIVAVALNTLIVQFGTIAQAYALCLFLLVAAFRASIAAVERGGVLLPFVAGFASGAAANSSLLTSMAAPILLAWMLFYNQQGARVRKAISFLAGAVIASVPLLRLLIANPENVIFGVFKYNAVYRLVDWKQATEHNVEVYLAWIGSADALLLLALAIVGFLFVVRSQWTRNQRAEYYLCSALVLGLGIFVCTPRPTFERYYLFVVPFLSILAAPGLYRVANAFQQDGIPFRTVSIAIVVVLLCLGKTLFDGRDDIAWSDLEDMSRTVDRVTPPNGSLVADEQVYFLTRRIPPEGMELDDSHKLVLPEALARRLHVVSRADLRRRIQAGEFDTVEMRNGELELDAIGLPRIYQKSQDFDTVDATVYWDRAAGPNK